MYEIVISGIIQEQRRFFEFWLHFSNNLKHSLHQERVLFIISTSVKASGG